MSNGGTEKIDLTGGAPAVSANLAAPREVVIERSVLRAARIPLFISLTSFIALIILVLAPIVSGIFMVGPIFFAPFQLSESDGVFARLTAAYAPHIVLFLVTVLSGTLGYKLVTASGAQTEVVIPAQDYPLLAPLVAEGKAEAIDQYVRLSSLSGFTGTFTQLGLTGLPLATIVLTLIFSALAIVRPQEFLDLAKLTLGAFIGSFVQRQVERRTDNTTDGKGERLVA